MMGKFYTFRQSNTGGSFDVDDNLAHFTIVEAENYSNANIIAEDIGIYFNGCEKELDCSCCGDRWEELNEWDKGTEEPMIYGKRAEEYWHGISSIKYEYRIHYLNGDVKRGKN